MDDELRAFLLKQLETGRHRVGAVVRVAEDSQDHAAATLLRRSRFVQSAKDKVWHLYGTRGRQPSNIFPMSIHLPIHGRGVASNPANRFEPIALVPDFEHVDPDEPSIAPQTQYFHDTTRTVLAYNDSPDVGFECSINPY